MVDIKTSKGGLKKVRTDECTYFINNSSLIAIEIYNNTPNVLKIPGALSSDVAINRIVSKLEWINSDPNHRKPINKLIIDDNISEIDEQAFVKIPVKELHWPSSCSVIPEACFVQNEYVETVTGIDHVQEIGESAFKDSHLKSITWPKNCFIVPLKCFMGSSLEKIDGLSAVKKICRRAFTDTNLKNLDFSDLPYCHFESSSLASVYPLFVKFPYYTTDEEKSEAFYGVIG